MEQRQVKITTEFIKLDALLKFEGLTGTGVFNLVGFSLIVINRWLKKSSLFFIKKRNKLIINCILIAAILFFMNYATLTICKVLLELPFPFVLSRWSE